MVHPVHAQIVFGRMVDIGILLKLLIQEVIIPLTKTKVLSLQVLEQLIFFATELFTFWKSRRIIMKTFLILSSAIFLLIVLLYSCYGRSNPEEVSGLYSININEKNETELTNEPGNFSFAGNKIIYDYISSMNLDGSDQQKIVPTNIFSDSNTPADFSVSTDGSKIVFSSILNKTGTNLYIMNNNGSNFKIINLPDSTSSKSSPHFSFDGNNIIFVTSYGICEANINGENFKKLLINPVHGNIKYIDPRYTPDGNHIIYVEFNDSTYTYIALHLLNLTTMHDTIFYRLTQFLWSDYEVSPNNFVLFVTGGAIHEINLKDFSDHTIALGTDAHYSPDFSYITFIDPDNSSFDLLNLQTNAKQNIKPTGKFNSIGEPKLSPDGKEIIFSGTKYVFNNQ